MSNQWKEKKWHAVSENSVRTQLCSQLILPKEVVIPQNYLSIENLCPFIYSPSDLILCPI